MYYAAKYPNFTLAFTDSIKRTGGNLRAEGVLGPHAKYLLFFMEEELNRCYLVFYYAYDMLNMFRAPLCPSSGAHDYINLHYMEHLILGF
jgi:hypothetical protein